MGKKEESAGGITLKNHGAGCMWGLFHHLQQNQWHKVVKRLPRARLVVYGKHSHSHSHSPSTGQERGKASPISEEDIESDNDDEPSSLAKPLVGQKQTESSPAHKHSMKSRIKAFTEEVYKRKGRHRRSTSYPVRKPPDENLPSHHQKGKSIDINNNNNNNNAMSPTVVEGLIPTALPESSHNMRLNYLKQNEVDQLGQVRDHTILHGNSMYAIEPSTCDSLQESKLFMDALNLLNMREEMFLKILKDPSLSLANQLQCRRSPNLRYGLNKSMSFSASATSDSRDFDMESSKRTQEGKNVKEDNQNMYIRRNHEEEILESASSSSPAHIMRKKGDERVGLMHFKKIREKIKYVIRDRKKEKNRIMMDALHHKVPYGTSPSKKLAEDAEQVAFDFGKSSTQDYKRTTSFDNSLDRYKQLIDVSSSNEGKDRSCDELKVNVQPVIGMKPASLRRILSLPDIRSNIKSLSASTKEEKKLDSVDEEDKVVSNSVIENQEKVIDVGETSDDSGRSRDFKDESKIVDESRKSSYFKDEPKTIDESRSHDLKDEPTVDESRKSSDLKDEPTVDESRKSSDLKDESKTNPDSEALKLEGDEKDEGVEEAEASVSEDSRSSKRPQKIDTQPENEEKPDSGIDQQPQPQPQQQNLDPLHLQHDTIGLEAEEHELDLYDSCISPQGAVGIVEESQIQQFYNDLLHVQEDERNNNNSEFNYVKGVLELSGFSKNEALGKWHSSQNPLNPSVFEEIGGCSGDHHECCEDRISNQLLLFDLINEVLLHIHERSFCFWPTPLTNRSSIHPLPKGSRVLEEVWTEIKWLLSTAPEAMDDAVSRDLGKNDGWMNLQLDAECVGLEMEELIFDDLVQEIFD